MKIQSFSLSNNESEMFSREVWRVNMAKEQRDIRKKAIPTLDNLNWE